MASKNLRQSTDWAAALFFALTLYSGVQLHVAATFNMLILHIAASLLLLAAIAIHIAQHGAWFKALRKPSSSRKVKRRRIAVLLLAALFLATAISGICMMSFHVALGMLHFAVGLAMSALAMLHLLKRRKLLLDYK